MNKKSQSTIMDLLTAVFVFFAVFILIIVLFSTYSARLEKDILREELKDKAFMLSDILLSNGIPADWNSENVQLIGLAIYDKHITESRFDELNEIPYENTRELLGLSGFDFYIRLIETNGNLIREYGSEATAKEVVALRRIIFYENSPAQLEVRVWRKE